MTNKKWPAEIAVEALLRERVDSMFGLLGGHINPIQDFAYRAGIDVFQVRHEQAAVHAADGYARITGRPGVAFATAGPGMTNTVTAMHMAYGARTPVVLLLGGHKLREDGRDTAQEADAKSVLSSVTKYFQRVTLPEQADLFIKRAFREAMTYPYGPVALEFPVDVFNYQPMAVTDQLGYVSGGARPVGPPPAFAGDPDGVAAAFELIRSAQRPVILGGDGVHWDGAADELRKFAEALSIPVNLRRHARGAIPETHALGVPAAIRKPVLAEADVVVVLGLHLNYFEGFGDWRSDAKFIQISRHPSDIGVNLPTAVEITGDIRSVLRQFNTLAAGEKRDPTTWSARTAQLAGDWRKQRDEDVDRRRDTPGRIHPAVFSQELAQSLPPGVPVILDSFTASGYVVQHLDPVVTGQVMDAGLSAAFGHGVGMALGASVARGYAPVVSVLGDGGIGLGGGDIEVAVRYGIPVVFVVYNNSALCGGLETYAYGDEYAVLGPNARGGFDVTRDMPYERMWELVGCHAERVEAAGEFPAALERALASGKPAVINVLADRDAQPGLYETQHAKDMFWHLPADEVQEPVRTRHHEQYYQRYHHGRSLSEDLR